MINDLKFIKQEFSFEDNEDEYLFLKLFNKQLSKSVFYKNRYFGYHQDFFVDYIKKMVHQYRGDDFCVEKIFGMGLKGEQCGNYSHHIFIKIKNLNKNDYVVLKSELVIEEEFDCVSSFHLDFISSEDWQKMLSVDFNETKRKEKILSVLLVNDEKDLL